MTLELYFLCGCLIVLLATLMDGDKDNVIAIAIAVAITILWPFFVIYIVSDYIKRRFFK